MVLVVAAAMPAVMFEVLPARGLGLRAGDVLADAPAVAGVRVVVAGGVGGRSDAGEGEGESSRQQDLGEEGRGFHGQG